MKLVTLLTFSAILYICAGAGLFVAPLVIPAVVGPALDRTTTISAQILGAALIALGATNWALRASADLTARRAITFGNLMFHLLAMIVMVRPQLEGTMNPAGWIIVGADALLAMGFAYIIFVRRSYCEVRFD